MVVWTTTVEGLGLINTIRRRGDGTWGKPRTITDDAYPDVVLLDAASDEHGSLVVLGAEPDLKPLMYYRARGEGGWETPDLLVHRLSVRTGHLVASGDRVTFAVRRLVPPDEEYIDVHDWTLGASSWQVQTIGPSQGHVADEIVGVHTNESGDLAVAWREPVGDGIAVELAYRPAGAGAFEPSSAVPGVRWANVGIDDAGVVSAVGEDVATPGPVVLARRDPMTGGWATHVVADDLIDTYAPTIAVDGSGFAIIQYYAFHQRREHYASCAPDGTCDPPIPFERRPNFYLSRIAARREGEAATIWAEERGCEVCTISELWARYLPTAELTPRLAPSRCSTGDPTPHVRGV